MSQILQSVVLKNMWPVVRHPWIARRLVALGLERQFYTLLHPGRHGGSAGRIRQVSLRITDRCNLRCHTCGQWGDSGYLREADPAALRRDEVSPDRYRALFGDVVAHGHRPIIYFWGGEPMLYEGLVPLIESATSLGLPVSIATNGTSVAAAADAFVRARMFLLQISIDGHTAALHDAVRPALGRSRNFADIETALAAVGDARRSARRGLPIVAALTVISQANVDHLADIYDTFRDRVDLFVFYLAWWIDEAHADAHDHAFVHRFGQPAPLVRSWVGGWKPTDYPALARQIAALHARSRGLAAPPVVVMPSLRDATALETYYTNHEERFGFDRCISIYQLVEINSNGDVSPCRDYHDYVAGNVKETTISEIWNSERYRVFRRSIHAEGLLPACSRCCGLMGY